MSRFVYGTLLALTLGFGACAEFSGQAPLTQPPGPCDEDQQKVAQQDIKDNPGENGVTQGCAEKFRRPQPDGVIRTARSGNAVAATAPAADTTVPAAALDNTQVNS